MDPTAASASQVPDGLTPAEVQRRVADGRTNDFTVPTSRSWGSIVRSNVFTLFNGIVFACFAGLLVLGRWQDALFGFAAICGATSTTTTSIPRSSRSGSQSSRSPPTATDSTSSARKPV